MVALNTLAKTPAQIRDESRRARKKLNWLGLILTTVYLLLLLGVVLCKGPSALWDLKFNELGDFAAGACAPLAFLWLVVGYRQQNIELVLNTDTLISQVEEMQQSVAQQTKQASSVASNEEHARRDTILKLVDIYMGRLAAHASVIAHYVMGLGDEGVARGWSNYSGGDRDYFLRVIMPGSYPKERLIGPLTEAMGRTNEVVDAVHMYIETYDRFLNHIRPLDAEGKFLPLFENGYARFVYDAVKQVEQAVQPAPRQV